MDITTKRLENCDVLKVSGRVSGATAAELEESFRAITDEGRYRIVFDMSDVSIISSVGLRVLIDIQRICTRSGRGQVVLASVSSHVDRTLNLAGYYTILDMYDTLTEAVGNVKLALACSHRTGIDLGSLAPGINLSIRQEADIL